MSVNYQKLIERAQIDIETAIEIWKELLTDNYSDIIEYVLAKGSAVKNWRSEIDYIPIISDLDIQVKFKENRFFFENKDLLINLDESSTLVRNYEKRFYDRCKKPLHLPRMQITILNKFLQDKNFNFFMSKDNIKVLLGNSTKFMKKLDKQNENLDIQRIREIDKERLLENQDYLNSIPEKLFDRTELDLWVLLHRISWRISPTPIRLLTQLDHICPKEAWSWNRTKVFDVLRENGYFEIAENYEAYYKKCWELFLSKFENTEFFHEVIKLGVKVMYLSISQIVNQKKEKIT